MEYLFSSVVRNLDPSFAATRSAYGFGYCSFWLLSLKKMFILVTVCTVHWEWTANAECLSFRVLFILFTVECVGNGQLEENLVPSQPTLLAQFP